MKETGKKLSNNEWINQINKSVNQEKFVQHLLQGMDGGAQQCKIYNRKRDKSWIQLIWIKSIYNAEIKTVKKYCLSIRIRLVKQFHLELKVGDNETHRSSSGRLFHVFVWSRKMIGDQNRKGNELHNRLKVSPVRKIGYWSENVRDTRSCQ